MLNRLVFPLLFLLIAIPAQAHKVVASAWADGRDIEGEVGFSSGEMAPAGTRIEVFGPDDQKFGEATIDEEGLFRFTPTKAVAHRFRANLGAGHVAEITLTVDELPLGLNPVSSTQSQKNDSHDSANNSANISAAKAAIASETVPALETMIAEAVQREIKPLRRELAAYKEKHNLQDILGGLGYICGIFGLMFFVYAHQNKKT